MLSSVVKILETVEKSNLLVVGGLVASSMLQRTFFGSGRIGDRHHFVMNTSAKVNCPILLPRMNEVEIQWPPHDHIRVLLPDFVEIQWPPDYHIRVLWPDLPYLTFRHLQPMDVRSTAAADVFNLTNKISLHLTSGRYFNSCYWILVLMETFYYRDRSKSMMNRAWTGLEKAPPGSFKNKLYGLGLRLLARVKPSEIFLKSISKEVTKVEVTFPSSLSPRLVRRRLRHIAQRGTIIHKRYFYGSVSLLPLTTAFTVLPLPNIPFFWVLFRSYSHWRALKVLQPSKELEELIQHGDIHGGLSKCLISTICKTYDLNKIDVLKYQDSI
ncbi:hypothetical protein RHGRI_025215 [Rhododendron griersonianum]|uniref:Uncharacterized protein n=1 Tax=Rhododendron griersonianum TaxID=479676 RepID=A0AAV6JER3_9ERIC|nr:hypothetical protein RHGRI_025215 [Rhododendron griersonianum]